MSGAQSSRNLTQREAPCNGWVAAKGDLRRYVKNVHHAALSELGDEALSDWDSENQRSRKNQELSKSISQYDKHRSKMTKK